MCSPGDEGLSRHGMPKEAAFGRPETETFDAAETARQTRFKRDEWGPGLGDGEWHGRKYAHILPESHRFENLHDGISKGVRAYAETNGIELHSDFANLKSSQACCLNFLFTLCRDLNDAAMALLPLLPGAARIEWVEFEYTGPDGGGATEWLGEPSGGKRGQYRTSADAAIWWSDAQKRSRLTLVEWKYTERKFGDCKWFVDHKNGPLRQGCLQPTDGVSLRWDCPLTKPPHNRAYWQLLSDAGIELAPYRHMTCPFAGPFYQLMRLHMLAAYCAQQGLAEKVDVAAVHFGNNESIETPPCELKHLGDTVTEAWKRLLSDPDDFRVCLAEPLADGIRASGAFPGLADYLHQRYGI